jgi:hypothetical protein
MEVYPAEHDRSQWVKRYWTVSRGGIGFTGRSFPCRLRVEAPEEQTGVPGEPTAVGLAWLDLWEEAKEASALRGVVTVRPKRRVLFSGEISLAPASLGRRKPHILIDESPVLDEHDV